MAKKTTKQDAPPQKEDRGLIAWFAHNPVAANILMMLFLVGGVISLSSMRSETFPSIDPLMITVAVPYPGATPYEVADGITKRVEEALVGIDGVKRISSTASEGAGTIQVELEDFADGDNVYNEVETAVNSLSDFPPEDAETPVITKVKVTPDVMTLALHGDVSEHTLKFWAETIEDELQLLPGVALTNLSGIRDYQISIEVSENALRTYGLTLQDVRNTVAAFSTDIPAGMIEAQQGDILLRIQEKRYTGEEFGKIVLKTLPDGSKLRLKDVGTVIDGFEDVNLISRFNGERAAFINISRNESEDTLTIANTVKDYLGTVTLPKGLNLSLQKDETVNLEDRISLMLRNAVLGFMLVFLLLMFFLDLKLAFWTSAAIPVSFLGGIMIIYFLGYSINMISLFALIVVLGVVVDDAIIVGESIFEAQEEDREKDSDAPAESAVLRGVRAVVLPVTVGVTTTIAAFAPLLMSTGTLGQIIGIIPVVVIAILIVSLIEAYFILPSHLSNPNRWSKGIMRTMRNGVATRLHYFVDNILGPVAEFTVKWRYATLAAFFALAIITAGMFQSGMIRFIFFPEVESSEIVIKATMPAGTPYAITEETMHRIEQAVQNTRKELNETSARDIFESVTLRIGQTASDGGPGSYASSATSSNIGQINVQLVPSDFRNISSYRVEDIIRSKIEHLPNIEELELQSSLVGGEPDINLELSHPQEDQLNQAAEDLKQAIAAIEGTIEVKDSYEEGKQEYVFSLNDQGHAVGLTPAALGSQLRGAFFGAEVQRLQRGQSELIVYVRYPKDERENIASLANMRIRLPDGQAVPLSTVADIEKQQGYSRINSVNGRRIVSVTADVNVNITTPNEVIARLESAIMPELMERYTGLAYSFEGQTRDQREDLQSLGQNMMIALLLIYVLLGSQLRSYIQPLIIMSAIPFGVIGAVWGHFLLGYDLTFISLFGVVALTGVIVNDSVVLMDYFNIKKREGLSTHDAGIAAIKRRFRPILLTTLTTSLGLLPIILEPSLQAKFLIPMVVSLAAGIVFATLIILLLVPNLLMVADDVKKLFKRKPPENQIETATMTA